MGLHDNMGGVVDFLANYRLYYRMVVLTNFPINWDVYKKISSNKSTLFYFSYDKSPKQGKLLKNSFSTIIFLVKFLKTYVV